MSASSNRDVGFALRFAVAGLATWRLTHLIAREDGPGAVVAKTREALGNHGLGELMDCFSCTSVWVAAALTPYAARRRSEAVVIGLALSGAACLIERLSRHQPELGIEPGFGEEGIDGVLR